MGTSNTNVAELETSLVDLCKRTVAMNLLQVYSSNTIDEMNCEEWVSGTEPPQRKTACDGCLELRKEVNDLRSVVNLIMPMLPLHHQNSIEGLAAALSGQQNATATNPFVMSQWSNLITPGIKTNSPTLLNGTNGHLMEHEHHITSPDEQQVKWSSPSSVDSNGQKTDSSAGSAGDNQHIDVIGDGSESPSSSTNSAPGNPEIVLTTQALANALKDNGGFFLPPPTERPQIRFPPVQQQVNGINGNIQVGVALKNGTVGPERKPRKPVNDDIVRIVRNQDLSEKTISDIQIPVPKALESDPSFKAVDEKLIIQQIMQNKKFEDMESGECMIQLCKKLAEKRVFGPRLMSQTTVAGLNHSNYANLPIKGICYIQHVCRKVLGDKFENEEDFWDKFREAMRKLAARCRRVRHAKKTKHNREEAQAEMLSKRYGDDIPVHLLANGMLRPKIEPPSEPAPSPPSVMNNFIEQLLLQRNLPADLSPELITQVFTQILNQKNLHLKSEPLSPPPSQ